MTGSKLALGAITFRDRPLPQVIAAAHSAGFDGIGLTVGQCISALERGISLDDITAMVDDAGLRIAEFELVRLCESGPTAALNETVVELAQMLRPDRVHVAAWRGDPGEIAEAFAAVCAAIPDIPVAVEFMAYNSVPSLEAAADLIERTGAPNARVVLDILHFHRSGARWDSLNAATYDLIEVVQLSDVVPRPRGDALDEARHRRTYPGDGTLESVRFLRALTALGPLPPISVEPINDSLELLPLAVVADQAMTSTQRLLAAIGATI